MIDYVLETTVGWVEMIFSLFRGSRVRILIPKPAKLSNVLYVFNLRLMNTP
jgi:hypothetical protein